MVQLQPTARKQDLISMYRGALVSGFVNASVYFNKLANNSFKFFKTSRFLRLNVVLGDL